MKDEYEKSLQRIVTGSEEILWWPLYDFGTFTFPLGGESKWFFELPLGMGSPAKTYND